MNLLPVNKRKYHAFISYAHADKEIVDRIYHLLNDVANIPIWYDSTDMQVSSSFVKELPAAIAQCRSLIIILSKNSVDRGWIEEEYQYAINHRTQYRDFRILPIRIDDSDAPGLLANFNRIDIPDGKLDVITAHKLLSSIYLNDLLAQHDMIRDVYVSRSWRDAEAQLPGLVCHYLDKAGLRLIGDSVDQPDFGQGNRVKSIISSCGGLVAIMPNRGNGTTSPYIVDEVKIAMGLGVPCLVIYDNDVKIDDDIAKKATCIPADEIKRIGLNGYHYWIDNFVEALAAPPQPHYIFYSTRFNDKDQRNALVKQFIERITAMPCLMGDQIRHGEVQKEITAKISNSFITVCDISDDNVNTLIEAGIARGSGRNYYLIAKGPRKSPPFMFRDRQVWYYNDDVELFGIMFRLTYRYRRRVINYELARIS